MLNYKRGGTFVDIGCNAPTWSSNTYLLERDYNFFGICVDREFFVDFEEHRPWSKYIIDDALTIDYGALFNRYNMPQQIDYLTIDIDPGYQSLQALKLLPTEYRFSTITFEYEQADQVRTESREYLKSLGYYLAFEDMPKNIRSPFEDWYVDPSVIDIKRIKEIEGEFV